LRDDLEGPASTVEVNRASIEGNRRGGRPRPCSAVAGEVVGAGRGREDGDGAALRSVELVLALALVLVLEEVETESSASLRARSGLVEEASLHEFGVASKSSSGCSVAGGGGDGGGGGGRVCAVTAGTSTLGGADIWLGTELLRWRS
jgi:hypothetical protein